MKNLNWKDIGTRAIKTFVQAAIPLILAALGGIDWGADGDTLKSVLISTALSAAAAGVSAVWNMLTGIFKLDPLEDLSEMDSAELTDRTESEVMCSEYIQKKSRQAAHGEF